MAYQVIARKYRPQKFSDVVGQEHVTQTLSHAIERNRIAHAYLFCGPRGTGKTTIARIFAKCLNCTGGPKVEFDENDPRCREIADGRSLDVLEIDAASNRGIDEIRGLRDTVRYAPASSKFKIYIIDEVHMLTKEAFNALLKTLEEPPEHAKFMFATTEPEKVLATILSRCQRFDLRRIPAALIVTHLAMIAAQEKVRIHQDALYAIARGAEGGMRDAESTLDQLISFCGDSIEEADVLSMFGLTAQSQLLDLSRAVLEGHPEPALRQLNELAANGKDLGRLLSDLLNHFRNLLVFRVSNGDLSLLEASEAEAAALREQSQLATTEGQTRILEVLGEAEMKLRDAVSKKILIEVTLLKAIEARNSVSIDTVLKKLEELREGGQGDAVPTGRFRTDAPPRQHSMAREGTNQSKVAQAQASWNLPSEGEPQVGALKDASPPAQPAPLPGQFASRPAAPAPSEANLSELWVQLVEAVGRSSPFTRTYLLEAHPVSFSNQLFVIGFPTQFEDHIGLVDNPRNQSLLQSKLQELGHPVSQIKFIKSSLGEPRAHEAVDSAPAPVTQTAPPSTPSVPKASMTAPPAEASSGKQGPKPMTKEDFKNDPLIRRALEIFKGQIVEVRA